jgi:NAD(P)-dependent dehydrogenase (short-subunit alcohol dehydrogenase family)
MPTVLITGASRGFGLLLSEHYASDGWRVIACCRNPKSASALQTLSAQNPDLIEVFALDVTDFDQIDRLSEQLKGKKIDVLLNNAGVLGKNTLDDGAIQDQAFGNSDFDEWDMTFRTNAMAPMKMAEAFVEHVAASEQKKIVTLTSIVGSIGGNNFGGLYAYRASKSAANAIMKSMSLDLASREIIAFPIHPGFARTDMGGSNADIDPLEGAVGIRKMIAEASPESAGRFWTYSGEELPW